MPRPSNLPEYGNPPVDEVAVGFQFQMPVQGFTDAHAGLFWQTLGKSYIKAETWPRVEMQPEDLQAEPAPPLGPRFAIPQFGAIAGSRTFLISEDEATVLQIQNNRFYRNWRRRDGDYPRFDELGPAFSNDFRAFKAFLATNGLPAPVVGIQEVSYINWIPDLAVTEFLRPATETAVNIPDLSEHPHDQTWTGRYVISDASGAPVARLNVQSSPAWRQGPTGNTSGYQLALSVLRNWGTPDSFDETLGEMLEMARNMIVRTFTALTTETAHQHWSRIK